ncbi:NAD(P)/FAD-dependent oxidoreductase [Candidatus Hecatella orcuttiae]|uniref:NAD(P)/FAD-dependent oxidoreductase n=1 Tax=Candidatus Hecatella orcuttiae TaxID=1935119 RepID=UPI00286820EA|nr:NAD(P)/FAD-dependent oxidoreductase [Candidatus Hecatella orcuttiae]
MSQETFDVAVVGAGPAGLMAARKAAQTGAEVLLLEKERSLGAKVCGEAVSGSTLADAEIDPSPRFICNRVKGIMVYAPNEEKKVEIYSEELGFSEGFLLEKKLFLQELACQAVQQGAEILVGATVLDVEKNQGLFRLKVKRLGETGEIKCKMLVGCDGVTSLVAKKFFSREGYEVIPCVQYKMVNCRLDDPHVLETYVGHEVAPLGYAWIFPKSESSANVGIGVRGAPAKPYLDKFIAAHPAKFEKARVVEIQAAPVPVGGQIGRVVHGEGVLLCGDAAGQVIPLTGGGIHTSIVAGKIAGEVAGRAAVQGDVDLEEYPRRYAYWSRRIANSLLSLKLIEKLGDSELNQLAEILTGEDIVNLASGFNIEKVGKKLQSHPEFAARLGEALLSG